MSEFLASFFYEASKIVPKNDVGNFIRLHLIEKCRSIRNVNLPAQNFKSSIMCQRCGVQLTEVPPRVVLKKQKKANRLIRRLLRLENKITLNKLQMKLLNNYRKKGRQKIVTICKVCDKRIVQTVDKPVFNKEKALSVQGKTKKRKKKDQFSGLNKNAVLSVQSKQSTPVSNKKKETSIIDLTNSPALKSIKKNNVLIKKKPSKPNKKQRNKNRLKEPNEVLAKSVNTRDKNDSSKNIANLLQKGSSSSSSLSDFLRNL